MKKNPTLVHLANFNSTNVGNGALISGLESVVSEDFSTKIEWVREAWDDYTFGFKLFDEKFVDLINNSDGLIINGAVAIHGREYLKETGMRFELPLSLVEKIKKPIIFYGISYRHFRGQAFHHADTLRSTINALVENSNIFFGVRNDGTKKWLQQTLGLDSEILLSIYEVPDTGVFTIAKPGQYPELLDGPKVIIFAPNDEDAVWRYGNDNVCNVKDAGYHLLESTVNENKENFWRENRSKLVEQITTTLTQVLQEFDSQLLMVAHYLDDYKFITDLVGSLNPRIAHQCSIATGLMRVQGTGYFYGRYQRADLAISMRVHSMSPSIGLGVPMVPLVNQPRMWDFLGAAGLDDLGLNAFANNMGEELYQSSIKILENPQERIDRFKKAKNSMRATLRQVNNQIEGMFI